MICPRCLGRNRPNSNTCIYCLYMFGHTKNVRVPKLPWWLEPLWIYSSLIVLVVGMVGVEVMAWVIAQRLGWSDLERRLLIIATAGWFSALYQYHYPRRG